MALRKTKDKEADKVYECTTGFVTEVSGVPWAPRVGDRVAGDHEARVRCPQYFIEASSPTMPNEAPVSRDDSNEHPPSSKAKPVKMVRAKRQVKAEGVVTPDGKFGMKGLTIIEAGETIPETHPVYTHNKDAFTKA
jgi:hypothetical protein